MASALRSDVTELSNQCPIFTQELLRRASKEAESDAKRNRIEYHGYANQVRGLSPYMLAFPYPVKHHYDLTVVQDELQERKNVWEGSEEKIELCSNIRAHLDPAKYVRVKKIVCLGLGHLSHPTRRHEKYNEIQRSQFQHLAAFTITKTLLEMYREYGTKNAKTLMEWYDEYDNKNNISPITIFLQDPTYTIGDRKVLDSFFTPQFILLKDPEGFLAVDEHTLVMPVCCSVPNEEILADLFPQGPAAMFTSYNLRDEGLETTAEDRIDVHDRGTPRVKSMYACFEEAPMPTITKNKLKKWEDGLEWFSSMTLYSKKV
jgi:hypothetical protein